MTNDTQPSNSARNVLKPLYSNICVLRKTNHLDEDKQRAMEEVCEDGFFS
jgi:hypothetical protein